MKAGGAFGGLVGLVAAAWFGTAGGGPGVVLGMVLGLFVSLAVAAGWLMLAMVLDGIEGEPPSWHRVRWAVGLLVGCFTAPPILLTLLA